MKRLEEANRRQAICKDCDKLVAQWFGWVCRECGCPVVAKSHLPKAECPLGKWKK